MNVIHALAWYFPESTGGTEVYVSGLVKELSALGVVSTVAAAQSAERPRDYIHDGVAVHRYPFPRAPDLAATRGEKPYQNFEAFVGWLERQPRGIFHQHSWTTSCGIHHLHAAKSLGFKTVLTVHVPANLCLRGTMMEFGRDPCDGRVEDGRCAACWAQQRGLPRPMALAISHLPLTMSRAAYHTGARSRFSTVLAARALAASRRRQIAAMADDADRIVAVCDWLAEALHRNGVMRDKVVLSRQGVGRDFVGRAAHEPRAGATFRLGFIGRCDPTKGLEILLRAMERVPRDLDLELIVHAVANSEEERGIRDRFVAQCAHDPRIRFAPSVAQADLPEVLAQFDMLAVPSQWQETGPLVILEAQAVGVPVLGSNLGGIAELVTRNVDGDLVDSSNTAAWTKAICDAASGKLPCLRTSRMSRTIRTMADVARDMSALYGAMA